ncbi:cytochrome P450 [Cubamyces sp. BRFM 1775]|nr:cytochrome P450 [Cubamyces sp. BRFM 1775]
MFYLPSIPASGEDVQLMMAPFGLIAHQVLRKHGESFTATFHSLLLFAPPFLGAVVFRTTITALEAWTLSFGIYWGALLLSLTIYRASPFHRLGCYPGPILCRLTGLRMVLASLGYRPHVYLQALHEQYGDIVRIGPNELSVRDPLFVAPLYSFNGLLHRSRYMGDNVNAKEASRRGIADYKKWTSALAPAALQNYRALLAARVHQLLESIGNQEKEIDISRWVHCFSYDFMTDVAFGGGSEFMRQNDAADVWCKLEHDQRNSRTTPRSVQHGRPGLTAAQHLKLQYMRDVISQRRQAAIAGPPLADDTLLAVIAGADVISSTLTSLIFCLLTHPRVCMRLQEEIDRFYPPGEDPCNTQPPQDMHYLTAVINEVLRLYPPLPNGSRRMIPRDCPGIRIGSSFIPPGATISVHTYSMQRDPRSFHPCSTSFWPDRWLLASGRLSFEDARVDEYSFVHNQTAFTPFSYGLTNRVGERLAMQELRIVLCAILQRYELRMGARWSPEMYMREYREHSAKICPPSIPVVVCLRP